MSSVKKHVCLHISYKPTFLMLYEGSFVEVGQLIAGILLRAAFWRQTWRQKRWKTWNLVILVLTNRQSMPCLASSQACELYACNHLPNHANSAWFASYLQTICMNIYFLINYVFDWDYFRMGFFTNPIFYIYIVFYRINFNMQGINFDRQRSVLVNVMSLINVSNYLK